jgi:hypothetical protein
MAGTPPAAVEDPRMPRLPNPLGLLPMLGLLAGVAAAPAAAFSQGGTEDTLFFPLWLRVGSSVAVEDTPALLNLPPGWQAGDAVVVLAPGTDWPPGRRDGFVAALLDAGTAVIELTGHTPTPTPDPVAAEVGAALRSAREALGAGLVLMVGRGAVDGPVVEAARTATHRGTGYAAAVQLGAPAPRIILGRAEPIEAWPSRAPMFCELLAFAQAADEPDIAAACLREAGRLR